MPSLNVTVNKDFLLHLINVFNYIKIYTYIIFLVLNFIHCFSLKGKRVDIVLNLYLHLIVLKGYTFLCA